MSAKKIVVILISAIVIAGAIYWLIDSISANNDPLKRADREEAQSAEYIDVQEGVRYVTFSLEAPTGIQTEFTRVTIIDEKGHMINVAPHIEITLISYDNQVIPLEPHTGSVEINLVAENILHIKRIIVIFDFLKPYSINQMTLEGRGLKSWRYIIHGDEDSNIFNGKLSGVSPVILFQSKEFKDVTMDSTSFAQRTGFCGNCLQPY